MQTRSTESTGLSLAPLPGRSRFLSEADCLDIIQRLARYTKGGGETEITLVSQWTGNVRWARNRIVTAGEDRDHQIRLTRSIRGASSGIAVQINDVRDVGLVAAARRAERLTSTEQIERVDADILARPDSRMRPRDEPVALPKLFFDGTYQLDADHRAAAAHRLMRTAADAGMLSAGYLEVSATSIAHLTSWGYLRHCEWTWAQYSTTVRDPKGVGSGWAGGDSPDWTKIDGDTLSAIALDKCLKSRNPVAVEPGRYTTILEPQAVADFVDRLFDKFWGDQIGRGQNEGGGGPWQKQKGKEPPVEAGQPYGEALFGEKVIDERLTLSTDPMDPELSYPPIENFLYSHGPFREEVYHPATWVEQGVIKKLPYDREFGFRYLGQMTGLPNAGSIRISVTGPTTSIDEMVATTKRGVLVTRFDDIQPVNKTLIQGFTRDGLWLIENGKISKPIKNFLFRESILVTLNNVEQVGVPQRVFHPCFAWKDFWQFVTVAPMIVPALKVRDFPFVALSDAI